MNNDKKRHKERRCALYAITIGFTLVKLIYKSKKGAMNRPENFDETFQSEVEKWKGTESGKEDRLSEYYHRMQELEYLTKECSIYIPPILWKWMQNRFMFLKEQFILESRSHV